MIILLFNFIIFNNYKKNNVTLPVHNNSSSNEAGVFDVKLFGAKGDGRSDDTKEIKKAIESVESKGGGSVYFGKGTYLVSTFIDVPKNVSIIGAGLDNTTLKRIDKEKQRILSLKGSQTVQDIGFESEIGILVAGDDITIVNTKMVCKTQGIQNSITVHNLMIINSVFDGNGYGILSNHNPSYGVKIINCRFLNNKYDDIEINTASQRWLIENCTFEKNQSTSKWAGFGVGIAKSAKNIVIKNSKFENIVGQAIHVEDYSVVAILNCIFKNNGADHYSGSPEADIAVLSHAKVTVKNSVFYKSDKGFSDLAIFNTQKPIGGEIRVSDSEFHGKKVTKSVVVENSKFITD